MEMQTSPAVKSFDATNIDNLATHAIKDGVAVCNRNLKALYQGHNGEVTCRRCLVMETSKEERRPMESVEQAVSSIEKTCRVGTVPTYGGGRMSVYIEISYAGHRLSITGVEGPSIHGNATGGCGQIDQHYSHRNPADNDPRAEGYRVEADQFNYAPGWDSEKWLDLLDIWKEWHLNDMRPSADGSAWEYEAVPGDVIAFLADLPSTDKAYPWA